MGYDPLQLPAGSLRHPITILAPSTQRDAAGQPSQTWIPILNTRAAIRAISQREQTQDSQVVSQSTHEITLRYPGAAVRIVSGQRVAFGTTVYNVQEVVNVLERNRLVKLQCVVIDATSTY